MNGESLVGQRVSQLPANWRIARLGSLCHKIGSGATPRGGQEVYLKSRVSHALIRSQHVFDRRFDESGIVFISADHARELKSAEVKPGDVLLNITGDGVTFGRACIVPEAVLPACVNQHVAIVRTDRSQCLPGYLLSCLTHPAAKAYIESFNSGGSRRAITKGHIESFEIPLPCLSEQEQIMDVLGSFDAKIEINRRMNETLEAMARVIFRSWFVDFDPVRAKVEGRLPYGMRTQTSALFPSHLRDSPIGKIPQGWLPDRWGALATLEYGKSLQNYVGSEAEFPVYGTNGQIGWNSQPLCPRPGIIIGRKGAYRGVHLSRTPFYVIDTAFYLAPKGDLDIYWAFFEIQQTDINAMDSGSAIPSTSREDFYAIPVVVPPLPIMKAFGETASLLYRKIDANLAESATLVALRDLLLPKLISGEIRLKDAEKELAAI